MRLFFAFFGMLAPLFADQPKPWQIGFQDPASTKMVALEQMHDFLFFIILGIALFVIALLIFVIFRFSEKRHPTPSKTTHNILLEVIWTAIPALIVAVIAVPSVKLIYEFDQSVEADLTVKVTGHQWYWSYEYDGKNVSFDSYLIPENELKKGQLRNLDVDRRMVVPAGKIVKLHITSADVIHAFAVSSFGIQKNAIPGRINETWFKVDKPGVYYGQCWAICGIRHGFMPIAIEVVPEKDFEIWVAQHTEKEEKAPKNSPSKKEGDVKNNTEEKTHALAAAPSSATVDGVKSKAHTEHPLPAAPPSTPSHSRAHTSFAHSSPPIAAHTSTHNHA